MALSATALPVLRLDVFLPSTAGRGSMTLRMCDDILRRAGDDDVAAFVAGLGAHVDHPIGRFDHVEIVLDHHDRIAQIDQPIEHVEQFGQIVEVQAGGRLVEQIERLAGVGPGKLGGQFHALGLAAGKRRRRLAEREVIEAHVAKRFAARGESWGCSRTASTASPHDMSSTSAIDRP